jgi:hypothetical protein
MALHGHVKALWRACHRANGLRANEIGPPGAIVLVRDCAAYDTAFRREFVAVNHDILHSHVSLPLKQSPNTAHISSKRCCCVFMSMTCISNCLCLAHRVKMQVCVFSRNTASIRSLDALGDSIMHSVLSQSSVQQGHGGCPQMVQCAAIHSSHSSNSSRCSTVSCIA